MINISRYKIIAIGKNVIDLQIKALRKLKNSLDSNFQKAIKKNSITMRIILFYIRNIILTIMEKK